MQIFNIDIFYKPIKSDVLVFDYYSLKFAKKLFPQKKLSIFHSRYDGASIYVLIKTFLKSGFKNFFKNYKINFFSYVKPKIIYTAIDNHQGFYKLKKIYPYAKYVSDQNGIRDTKFYNLMKSKKNGELKYFADVIFCLGENEKKRLSKIIDAKIYPLGKTLNNSIAKLKIKKFQFKNLVYISGWKSNMFRKFNELRFLVQIASEMKRNFYFIERPSENFKHLLSKLKKYDCRYVLNKDFKSDKFYHNSIFVSENSTLLYEMLCKNYRVVFIGREFVQRHNYLNVRLRPKGPFWGYYMNKNQMTNLINKVNDFNQKEWSQISNKYSAKFLKFDENNIKKKMVIKKLLNS